MIHITFFIGYMHMCEPLEKSSVKKKLMLLGIPIIVFVYLNVLFYSKISFLYILKYMLIDYMNFGGCTYIYLMTVFCVYCHIVVKILFKRNTFASLYHSLSAR